VVAQRQREVPHDRVRPGAVGYPGERPAPDHVVPLGHQLRFEVRQRRPRFSQPGQGFQHFAAEVWIFVFGQREYRGFGCAQQARAPQRPVPHEGGGIGERRHQHLACQRPFRAAHRGTGPERADPADRLAPPPRLLVRRVPRQVLDLPLESLRTHARGPCHARAVPGG
jgi:hypothetical protein